MSDQWHYSHGGGQCGPVPAAELKRLAVSGKLLQTDMVWREGMAAWSPAGSVRGLFSSTTLPTHATPPPLSDDPPTQSRASETKICAFCRKPMPADAIQCASCQNWRRDIHLLVATYRKLALAQMAAMLVGLPLAVILFITGMNHPSARNQTLFTSEFSFEKFATTPFFAIGVVLVVVVVVVYAATQGPAVRTRHQIQKLTGGLWKRPWWTF